jgi:hypothetical protein
VKPETRDRLIASMNRIAAEGNDGKELYTSVSELMAFLGKLMEILTRFESPERMREDLDRMEEPSPRFLAMIEGTARHGSTLIHRWIKWRITLGLKALPNPATGRPLTIPTEQRKTVCDEVSRLERKGLSLWSAKRKVAAHYRVNARTIHRIWDKRSDYEASSEVTLDQAQNFIQGIIKDTVHNSPSDT